MEYMSAYEAGQQWNIAPEFILMQCKKGRIPGALKLGEVWTIPVKDRRCGCGSETMGNVDPMNVEILRKSPFLMMTNLYCIPGSGDDLVKTYEKHPEAGLLLEAELAYFRGESEKTYDLVTRFLLNSKNFETRIGARMLLALCATYEGNVSLWEDAKKHLATIPCRDEAEKRQRDFWFAANNSMLFDNTSFPEWFQRGSFDDLPLDSYPFARYIYAKYWYLVSEEILAEQKREEHYLDVLKTLSAICEPLISQSQAERTIIPQIYHRLVCAIAYHNSGNDELAVVHLDRAIELALPDKLYAPLAEHRRPLNFLVDDRLGEIDQRALQEVKRLNKKFLDGWISLHNTVLHRTMMRELTVREHEVSRLAVSGFTNLEIAEQLHISINTVKQALRHAMDKTGCKKRLELSKYL